MTILNNNTSNVTVNDPTGQADPTQYNQSFFGTASGTGTPAGMYGGTDSWDLYNNEQGQWRQYGQQGVQAPGIDQGLYGNTAASMANYQQSLAGGQQALGLMASYANGAQTPAERQALQTQSYNLAAQRAMAANAGGGAALAAAHNQAAMAQNTAASSNANSNAALAAQERETYGNQYLNTANAMRQNAQNMYGIQNNAAYGNAQNQMDVRKANDALMLGYSGLQASANAGIRNIGLGQGQFELEQGQQQFQNAQQLESGVLGAAGGAEQGAMGLYQNLSGGGSQGTMGGGDSNSYNPYGNGDDYSGDFNSDVANSDENLKTGVARQGLMRPFLDTLAHSRATYRYKDPNDEPRVIPTGGRYAGVMAQDLERIPDLGHQLVIDAPHGKMVDQKTLLSAIAAGLGDVHERVRQLEGGRKYDED